MQFYYELTGTDKLTADEIAQVEDALDRRAYSCQCDFEREQDIGHPINVVWDAVDEAYVTEMDRDGDDVYVTLDCSKVRD